MDPGTGLAILGSAAGSAKLVEKILGPTADYLGDGIRQWTEQGVRNIGRIFNLFDQHAAPIFEIACQATMPRKLRAKDHPFWFYGGTRDLHNCN